MMNISTLIGLLLSLTTLWSGQANQRAEAKLVRPPFVGGDAMHAIQEAALDLKGHATGEKDVVAIRVCSKRPMPVALSTATASPFIILDYLEHYGISRERVFFLRSEDCVGANPSVAATEFWALPEGANPPPSVEAIRSSEARLEVIRTGDALKGASEYHSALRQMLAKLYARPEAVAVVVGAYYERPSSALKRNLMAAKRLLKKGRAPAGRFYILASPDPGVHGSDEPEPNYPNLFIVEVGKAL